MEHFNYKTVMVSTIANGDELETLRFLFFHPDTTRLELVGNLNISHLTVSKALKNLQKKGYIYPSGKIQGESGRPSTTYRIGPDCLYSIGIHFDFDVIRCVLIDASNKIHYQVDSPYSITPTSETCAAILTENLHAIIENIFKEAKKLNISPAVIGVSLPGMVDSENGIWISGLQFPGIRNIPIRTFLEEKIGIPVFIEDNSRSLVVLEKAIGLGRDCTEIVLLYLGSGMGAGIVSDDKILRGFHGTAGEIGHIPHGDNSYRCSCGNVGCFETIVSTYGLIRIFTDRLKQGIISKLQDSKKNDEYTITIEDIYRRAIEGDHFTLKTLHEIGQYIGDACDILIKLYNPEILIISGENAIFSEFLREAVTSTVNFKIAPEINKDFHIDFADYKHHHEAYGAAIVGINDLLKRLKTGIK